MRNVLIKVGLVLVFFVLLTACSEKIVTTNLRNNITVKSNNYHSDGLAIESLAFSPDGKFLAVGTFHDGIYFWEINKGKLLKSFPFSTYGYRSIVFSPNGNILASTELGESISLWDVNSGKLLKTFEHKNKNYIDSIAFNHTGEVLASAAHDHFDSKDSSLNIWNVKTGNLIKTLKNDVPSAFQVLAFSPTEDILVYSNGDNEEKYKIELYEIHSGKLLKNFSGHTSFINDFDFSFDGKTLASASSDNTIKLWNISSGKLLKEFNHNDAVNSISFSPDGKTLVSASRDKSIKLWDINSGKLLKIFMGHIDQIRSVVFSPNGKIIASGGYPDLVKVWDINNAKPIIELYPFRNDKIFSGISITQDGYYVASDNSQSFIQADKSKNRPDIVEARLRGVSYPAADIKTTTSIPEKKILIPIHVDTLPPLPTTETSKTVEPSATPAIETKTTSIKPLPPAPVADRDLPDKFKFPRNCQLPNEEKLPNDTRPRLFIMAVGISDYSQLPKGNQLDAPPHDAEAIIKLFKKMEGKLFSKVHTCLLTSHSDLKPTADNLRDSLRFIRMAGQYDTAILFMAGHAVRDEGDKYYFLGADAKFDSKGSVMPSTVLPWTDIIDNLKQPATTLAFIDTCHSGSLINKKFRSIDYNFASKLLTQGGTAVLTSANNDESAIEQNGDGFFTRAIIDGLEQRKADSNNNGTVTLDELDRYVSQTVASHSDGQQHPVSSYPVEFDRDIPLWQ